MRADHGWVGKILRVDLTDGSFETIPTERYLPKYVGGRGIAARIYWDEVPPDCGAFDVENRLIVMTGPVSGCLAIGSARMTMVGKAPQTYPVESYARSSAGGHWGPELKFAGYDGLIIAGRAPEPSYIWIEDDRMEVLGASEFIWSLDTHASQRRIWERHGSDAKVLLIGPAGENMSRIAVVSSDSNVAFGQGGFGGVMGSKNLKAVVVRGTGGIDVADPESLTELHTHLSFLSSGPRKVEDKDPGNRRVAVGGWSEYGKNTGVYDDVKAGRARWWYEGCYSCAICNCAVGTGKINISYLDGSIPSGSSTCVEYGIYIPPEQQFHGGKMYGKVSVEASHLLDMLGLNAWEFYFTIRGYSPDPRDDPEGGARMDTLGSLNLLHYLYEAGVLNEDNTGLPFDRFGSREFIVKILEDAAHRRGFGALLAEGLPRALNYMMEHPDEFNLGEDAVEALRLAYHQGYPRAGRFGGYPRHHLFCGGQGCGYLYHPQLLRCCIDQGAFSVLHVNTGIMRVPGVEYGSDEYWRVAGPLAEKWIGSREAFDQYTTGYKAEAANFGMLMGMEFDSIPLCDFKYPLWYSWYTEDQKGDDEVGSKLLKAVTGLERTQEEIYEMMDTLCDLERAIACREGRRREDDWLHDHEFQGMDLEGRRLRSEDLRGLLDEFYALRGWDPATGVPTKRKLKEAGLGDISGELDRMGLYT